MAVSNTAEKENDMSIPVYRFNEHNEAFYYWHKARIDGLFSKPLDLFHIDAHKDMELPPPFSESLYDNTRLQTGDAEFYRRFASTQINIYDFILPAILSGAVRNVYFVYPGWRGFKPKRKRISLGSAFGEGKVLKTGIQAPRKNRSLLNKAYPDMTFFQYSACEARLLPRNRRVILDIDLDYFACRDTITNLMGFELEITEDQYNRQDLFFEDTSLPYSGIVITFAHRDNRYFARIHPKRIPDRLHVPPHEEIQQEIESLIRTLIEKQIKPVLVTLCRSCDSGYCPKDKVDLIERTLIEKLKPLTA